MPLVDSVNLLGITLQSSLKWDEHINIITAKANSRRYFLLVFKRAGVSVPHLIKFCITVVRPTVEYVTRFWHPGTTDTLSDKLEVVQRLSLRVIFPDLTCTQARQRPGLPTLSERHVSLCRTFASSSFDNPDFRHWFPKVRGECHLRNSHQLSTFMYRTKRLKNSPIKYAVALINSS